MMPFARANDPLSLYFANTEVSWNKRQDFIFNQRARQRTSTQQGSSAVRLMSLFVVSILNHWLDPFTRGIEEF
jgi:hypothetical protein